MSSNSRGQGQRRPPRREWGAYEDIAVKGRGLSIPMTQIRDHFDIYPAIDPSIGPSGDSAPVILHCDSNRSSTMKYTGVYSTFRGKDASGFEVTTYRRNPEMTRAFLREVGHKNVRKLGPNGYCFLLCRDNDMHEIVGHKDENDAYCWFLFCTDGQLYYELVTPRARAKGIWNEPEQFLFLPKDEVHSPWYHLRSTSGSISRMAMTPLKTVRKALALDLSVPRGMPPQRYQVASDFQAFNRNFVLHVDPRTCQLPLDWVDTLMGVYTPSLTIVSGYPVWQRQHQLTKELVGAIPESARVYLEGLGIRLSASESRKQFLYIERDFNGTGHPYFLSTTSLGAINHIRAQRKSPILIGTTVSDKLDCLFSDTASLFANQDRAFATWSVRYGEWVQLHVAFTPETCFREAISLAAIETDAPQAAPTEKKTKTNRKKKKKPQQDEPEGTNSSTAPRDGLRAEKSDTAITLSNDAAEAILECAVFGRLAQLVQLDLPQLSFSADETTWSKAKGKRMKLERKPSLAEIQEWDAERTLLSLFSTDHPDPLWLSVSDLASAPILEAALSVDECSKWIHDNANHLVVLFAKNRRKENLTLLLNAGVSVTAKSVAVVYESLAKDRSVQLNNELTKSLCDKCTIEMESNNDFHLVQQAASERIGKAGRKNLLEALKQSSSNMRKLKKQRSNADAHSKESTDAGEVESHPGNVSRNEESSCPKGADDKKDTSLQKPVDAKDAAASIQESLQWYVEQLQKLEATASSMGVVASDETSDTEIEGTDDKPGISTGNDDEQERPKPLIASEQTVAALSKCESEDALAKVEYGVDLFNWDSMSEWSVDITERAHKWFAKHKKKDQKMCERVLRRLVLLSTGRWPYCLAKPLNKSKGSKKISLYETKVDKAGRIIWEVAIAFSPRRSSLDSSYCEQVIRVWDIVLDHDNLSSAIDLTVERIERSHLRGEECALYAQLKDSAKPPASPDGLVIPRVFSMTQEVARDGSARGRALPGKSRHFHPASDNDREYTLLKFYELNGAAVKMLLDGREDEIDLPFTPGPKEHEIIHYQSDPQRSILLMGRSGTGKTTCLVFRMWAQHTQYMDLEEGPVPQQLFLTKNKILCREVERSFNNMGLAWRKRLTSNPQPMNKSEGKEPDDETSSHTRFLTSSEWLDTLDVQLPGPRFFSSHELEQRRETRKQKDSVSRGVEELLFGENVKAKEALACRNEMTYLEFRKLWRKIKSGTKTEMDCTLVWREIKSFVKGSVASLQIDRQDRSLQQNRFLSLDEYLALPRKQSRMDESQRREVYELYRSYEKVKKENHYYDECDVVYNIAGRIAGLNQQRLEGPLHVDSLFVDEVQDFTQAELYILAKLCRDPDNLFLAGDTAQSIAVGVDFRFTDVRQIFYQHFRGIEPKLLQLTHNYRSHTGILRLAACVVELLYHFFSSSLDRLPPDLGLFDGPKPVVMEVTSEADLVLMLEGAKRETSRIEFGAHQVVIVRSEEAKESLPDEFGIDRDWVMTVQQAKGLEFDDVLLYNFFTDSPAKDLWRVVSSYTEDDIAAYYADATVVASGVQKYEWENPLLKETRHLDFDSDQHKILETELKMLYTAITRARVNCFIAETGRGKLSESPYQPMFNYFQRRAVVDIVNKDSMSSMRVFGVEENNADEWRQRGEYYLKNAEGERQIGCLRLAAKCFDRANEEDMKRNTLALLHYTEMEESQTWKKAKSTERKEKLYSITAQLLQARDAEFLSKASLCLLRTGAFDESAANMFELYARLHYTNRLCEEGQSVQLPFPPSLHEKKHFSYAGTLFARCCKRSAKASLAAASFRNYVCAEMYEEAESLLSSGMLPQNVGQTFVDLQQLCLYSAETARDPIASFQLSFMQSSERCSTLRDSVKRAAHIGCRKLHKSDHKSFAVALKLIPESSDRIKLLSSIDEGNVGLTLGRRAWATHHLFSRDKQVGGQLGEDLANMIVVELEREERYSEASQALENRGCLLEAADRYDLLARESGSGSRFLVAKATRLRVKYVELMLLSKNWKDDKNVLLSHSTLEDTSDLSVDTIYGALLSQAMLNNRISDLFDAITECKESVMMQYRCLKHLIDSCSKEKLLEHLPGETVIERLDCIHTIAKNLRHLGVALRKSARRSAEENIIVRTAEEYFDLVPQRLDPTRLDTNPIVNLRLREALHTEQLPLPTVAGGNSLASGLTQSLDRVKMHTILSQHVNRRAASMLVLLDDLVGLQARKIRAHTGAPLSRPNIEERVELVQSHLLYIDTMSSHAHGAASHREPWTSLREKVNDGKQSLPKLLMETMLQDPLLRFTSDETCRAEDAIFLKGHTMHAMKSFATQWYQKLPINDKKLSIENTVAFWRLLCFCDSRARASDALRHEINRIERHPSTTTDFRRKSFHCFIDKLRREVYPRLWLWAVEWATDDIMNSASAIERMIRTSYRDGLVTVPKPDQVSLLEINAVAIFAALSLRFSEVKCPAILMPKRSYFLRLLAQEEEDYEDYFQPEGFGLPLKNALLAYCHENFDSVFQQAVARLENGAAILLDNDLLSADDSKESGRFERALHFCIFVVCNAVIFSSVGTDMDTIEYSRGPMELPSLPLQGSIRKLVEKLESMFLGKLFPTRLRARLRKKPGTFYDLARISNSILERTTNEGLVSCKLQQRTMDSVDVHCFNSLEEARVILASVPFESTAAIFEDDTKSTTFLDNVELVDPNVEDEEHARKADELNAGRAIARFIEKRMFPDASTGIEKAVAFHQQWISVLKRFIRQLHGISVRQASLLQETSNPEGASPAHCCGFDKVVNPFQDPYTFTQQRQYYYAMFNNAVVDTIECTYCGLAFDPNLQQERFTRWDIEGRRLPWLQFAQHFNQTRFGTAFTSSDQLHYHMNAALHHDNAMMYNNRLNELATVIARLKMGTHLLQEILNLCTEEGQREDATSSWYLHTAEHARELINRLASADFDLGNAGVIWSRQPAHTRIWQILPNVCNLPQEVESFFLQKRDEEARMIERVEKEKSEGKTESKVGDGPSSSATTLNPDAAKFVPQFML